MNNPTQENPVVTLIKGWIRKDTNHLEELKARLEAINSGQVIFNPDDLSTQPEIVKQWITVREELLASDYQQLEEVLSPVPVEVTQ